MLFYNFRIQKRIIRNIIILLNHVGNAWIKRMPKAVLLFFLSGLSYLGGRLTRSLLHISRIVIPIIRNCQQVFVIWKRIFYYATHE